MRMCVPQLLVAVKQFGGDHHPPQGSVVHFLSDDPRDGPLVRYTAVTRIA